MVSFVVFAALAVQIAFVAGGEVCFPDIGCFDTAYPFYDPPERFLSFEPDSPESIDTEFILHTRRNPSESSGYRMVARVASTLTNQYYDPSKETKLISHGFLSNRPQWVFDMVQDFLNYADYNVIMVLWHGGNSLPYTQAVANTRVVGAEAALLIKRLQLAHGIGPDKFHIIGHSLGAHVAGYCGENVPNMARVTGLDSAGPAYKGTDPRVRLDSTDALFVDTVHTNTQTLGILQPIGHVDFYPNGGETQNCPSGDCDDHGRATLIFSDSISRCAGNAYSYRCPNANDDYSNYLRGECDGGATALMGYHSDLTKPTGGATHIKYFSATTNVPPYCSV